MDKIKECFIDGTKRTILCVIISGISLVFSLGKWLNTIIPFDTAWIAIILCGIPIVIGAAVALVKDHDIKADMLVSMALIASVFIHEYFAAGEVAFIMQIGTLLEDFTSHRARKGIEKLVKLTPQTARVKTDGIEKIIPVDEVAEGDVLVVLAGETIPVDGVIFSGETSIDQSVMTGESIPVDKKAGDKVTSGTLNQFGTFEMRALKKSDNSSLQRMVKLAKEVDAAKAPIVSLADKWATWMVVGALIISALTYLFTGQSIRAVTVLVVFCPCAFILATPTAIMAGIANAAKYGILVRSGDALERLAKIKYVAFDKTGTLTYGRPSVTEVTAFSDLYTESEILKFTASAEQRSEHPLGKAIVSYYKENGGSLEKVDNAEILAGKGIKAVVNNKSIMIGKPDMFAAENIEITINIKDKINESGKKGATVILAAVNNKIEGMILLSDVVRSDSTDTIKKLKESAIIPVLLTGDNVHSAKFIASQVEIKDVQANLLPQDKMNIINKYNKEGRNMCMIGDGVNDALALNTAFAGIAMGGIGSDIAVESADAVLVSDEIKRLPYLFDIAQKSMKKISHNIIISLAINIAAVFLSVFGLLNPVTGALMHNAGSVFVVINAAMLLKEKDN